MSAPGWYPNPDPSASGERFFDGVEWTEELRDLPSAEAASPGSVAASPPEAAAPVWQPAPQYQNPAVSREVQWGSPQSLRHNAPSAASARSKLPLLVGGGLAVLAVGGIIAYALTLPSEEAAMPGPQIGAIAPASGSAAPSGTPSASGAPGKIAVGPGGAVPGTEAQAALADSFVTLVIAGDYPGLVALYQPTTFGDQDPAADLQEAFGELKGATATRTSCEAASPAPTPAADGTITISGDGEGCTYTLVVGGDERTLQVLTTNGEISGYGTFG